MPTDRSFLRAWKMMRTKDFIDGCLKLKAVAKIFPSMLPAYKFHSCSYRLYSLLVFLISKCYSISLSNILVLRQHIGVRLKDCCERLLLMSLSFYHTLADSFLSSLLSIQAFLNIQLANPFLWTDYISIRKTPLSIVSKAFTIVLPCQISFMDKKLVVASQRQLKSGQVSVQLIASLWQVYIQLARQLYTLNTKCAISTG